MAFEIDRIRIWNTEHSEEVEFLYKDGEWSQRVTTREETDGVEETTTSSGGACTAEDVIVALLVSMCRYDKTVAIAKGAQGTPMATSGKVYSVDAYGNRRSTRLENWLHELYGDSATLKLK